jgi:putative ABC transport system permease protein
MNTRFLKVLRDLTTDYAKNLMLVVAIAIGVFGIGAILGAHSVLTREMTANYRGSTPASATLELKRNLPAAFMDSVKALANVQQAERHATVSARMLVGDRWMPMLVFVIDDFAHKELNRIDFVSGATQPAPGEMLIERTAQGVMNAGVGDSIVIKTPHGESRSIKIAGTVHDAGLAPAWQEQAGYAYVSLQTLQLLDEQAGFDELRIRFRDEGSRTDIEAQAVAMADWLEKNGYPVHEVQVPPPGKHPHQSQMNAVLSIFITFSFLILVLGSILVATSMATLMVKQVRQIGIMKTIGATSRQITGLYFVMVTLICVAALLVAIPLSRLAATAFYLQIAQLLNLELGDSQIPFRVVIIQVIAGTLIPLIAAAFPVIRGSRIRVRAALDNYGVRSQPSSWWTRVPAFVGDAFKLSLRNVFRQRSRLAMTLALLAAGGAMFMTALNVAKAWDANLGQIYIQRLYDLELKLTNRGAIDSVLRQLDALPGVSAAEGWDYSSTALAANNSREVTHTYPDKGHGSFTLLALPPESKLLNPNVVEGQWLSRSTPRGVVLNQSARMLKANLRIGDPIGLLIDGVDTQWQLVGFTEDVASGPAAYVSIDRFAEVQGTQGQAKMIRIAYKDRSKANALVMNRKVEKLLQENRIAVTSSIPVWLLRNAVAAHMKVLVNSLLAMALLMATVGLLGLTSTMSMNLAERTREIGVMRAIGATHGRITLIVIGEGWVIGAISIVFGFLLSLMLASWMGKFIGNMAFRTPLSLSISIVALAAWIGIVILGSSLAAYFPVRRINRITTREALAFE